MEGKDNPRMVVGERVFGTGATDSATKAAVAGWDDCELWQRVESLR